MAGIVQAFICQPAGERPVTNDGDDLVLLVPEVATCRDTECRGNGGRRVASAKDVVLALRAFQESRDAVLLTQRLEALVAATEQLVRIPLMPNVPEELVARRLEGRV